MRLSAVEGKCVVTASNLPDEEKPLTAVMEDYLETIFDLSREKGAVRVRDIARRLAVKMPSVSSMLKTLGERGLVHYEKYEHVQLTRAGAAVGREMRRRHEAVRRFLVQVLQVEAVTADEEACRVEHALSSDTLNRLIDFMAFIETCPRTGVDWLEQFEQYRQQGKPAHCPVGRPVQKH